MQSTLRRLYGRVCITPHAETGVSALHHSRSWKISKAASAQTSRKMEKKTNKQTKKRRKRRRKGRESQATPKWIAIDGAEHRLNTIEINNEEGNILVSKRGRRCFSLSFLLSFFLAPRQMIFLTVKAKPIKRPARTRTIGRAGIVPAGIVPDYDDPERETEREREREKKTAVLMIIITFPLMFVSDFLV